MRLLLLPALFFALTALPLSAQPKQTPLPADAVNGTWSNGNNTFKVLSRGKGRIDIEFEGVSPFLEVHDGASTFTDRYTASLDGDQAVLWSDVTGTLTLTFSVGTLNVEQEGGDIGNGISAAGTYLRESTAKPQIASRSRKAERRLRLQRSSVPELMIAPADAVVAPSR